MAAVAQSGPRLEGQDPIHVRVVDVTKSYDGHPVLKGVTFDILRGRTNVIIGSSGSGKTVLMRQLVRLERPDSGQIVVDGEDLVPLDEVRLSRVRRKFGMVFQMSALFDSMTVFDNVAFPLREQRGKYEKAQIAELVKDRLDALGVGKSMDKLPSELSGGMRKRVAVARALVMEPDILIYDEPTTGLDPITSRTVDELIESTRERFGVTSIVISHDMESVFAIGHRVNLLYKGVMALSATADEFVASDNPRVREFLQASGIRLKKPESTHRDRSD